MAYRAIPPIQGGGGSAPVATLAALSSLSASDGARVSVATLRSDFYLDATSTLDPSSMQIVAASGGGNWIRLGPGNLYWQIQTAWFYNASTGNDENSGLATGARLKTMGELYRRLQGSTTTTAVTVNIAAALSDLESAVFEVILAAFPMRQFTLVEA